MNAEQDKSNWPDPGLAELVMLLRFHGLGADPEQIRHRFGRGTIGIPEMLRCAKELGLKARSRLTTWERLVSTPMPAIVALRDGGFLLLGKVGDGKALVQSPLAPRPTMITLAALEAGVGWSPGADDAPGRLGRPLAPVRHHVVPRRHS